MNAFSTEKFNKLIDKFDNEALEQYFHELVDSWLQRQRLSYIKYSQYCDLDQWWQLEEQFDLMARLILNSESEEQFLENFNGVKNSSLFWKLFNVRKAELREYFLSKSSNLCNTLVKDFDWSVKLALSSDKLARVNQSLCALNFFLNNSQQTSLQVEMNETELDSFIETLEKIQNKVDVFE